MIYEHIPKGLCDMHLHLAPSLIPRDCDIAEMAAMAKDAGYRAIVAKDHHALTAPLCSQLISEYGLHEEERSKYQRARALAAQKTETT